MARRILLVPVLASLIASCAAAPPAPPANKPALPATEAACLARGGEWIFAGPQNITKYCFLKTRDGGKACSTSAQCESECVERETGNVCAEYFSGCFAPTGRGTVTQCVN